MVNFPRSLQLLAAAAVIWSPLTAAQTSVDRPDDKDDSSFCFISGTSVAVVDNVAFIYGGWSNWKNLGNDTGPNNQLRRIDFTKSLRTGADVSEYVSRSELDDDVPRMTYAPLWPVAKEKLYTFFGYHEVSPAAVTASDTVITKVYPLDSKFILDTDTLSWQSEKVKSADFEMLDIPKDDRGGFQKVASRMTAWVPSIKKGFLLGGISYIDGPKIAYNAGREFDDHHGFLIYDAALDSWTNQTMPMKRTRQGALAHLSTKDDEILVAFGGNTDPRIGGSGIARSMREFNIYSTKNDKWYSFVAPDGAPVPDPRTDFCFAIASAKDNSSHQITIYGGSSGADLKADNTVWTLSLPSFDWVQLAGNASDSSRDPGKRVDPACARVGNKFMLSWGGRHYSGENDELKCDENGNAAFLLDLSSGQWVDKYDPEDKYTVPDEVVSAIGGSGNGGATKSSPTGGFGDDELKSVMTFAVASGSSPNSTSDQSGSEPEEKKSSTGAIVGGVVGGVAAVLIVLGLVFFLRRRKRAAIASSSSYQPPAAEVHGNPIAVYEAPGETTYQGKYSPKTNPAQQQQQQSPPGYVLSELHGDAPISHPLRAQ